MFKIVTAVLGAWSALTFAFLIAVASSTGTSNRGDRIVTGGPAASVVRNSTRVPADHNEIHARMTSQMRVSSPNARMQARMASDPMWQMMYHPAHIRAEEAYQGQMDRMLARTP